jgi:hypothetical protein
MEKNVWLAPLDRRMPPDFGGADPIVTCAWQFLFWATLQPYAWLLFYPAVFLSAWIGGLREPSLAKNRHFERLGTGGGRAEI